jgi:hypothetical protein
LLKSPFFSRGNRTAAKKIQAAVSVAYPKAKVTENDGGKPAKGAFEVTVGKTALYSKLQTFGPAKSKEHLATPEKVLEELLKHYPKVRRAISRRMNAESSTSYSPFDVSYA